MVQVARAGEQATDASAEALAAAVLRLKNRGREHLSTMGQNGRDWVSREHSRAVLAQRLDDTLRGLLC